MSAGVTVGGNLVPDIELSFPVGGSLSSLRPEAAAVHELVTRVVSTVPDGSPLLTLTLLNRVSSCFANEVQLPSCEGEKP